LSITPLRKEEMKLKVKKTPEKNPRTTLTLEGNLSIDKPRKNPNKIILQSPKTV
jgi:hypothetical protein